MIAKAAFNRSMGRASKKVEPILRCVVSFFARLRIVLWLPISEAFYFAAFWLVGIAQSDFQPRILNTGGPAVAADCWDFKRIHRAWSWSRFLYNTRGG